MASNPTCLSFVETSNDANNMIESDIIGENLSTNINPQVRPVGARIDNAISTSITEMSESYLNTSGAVMTLSETQAGEMNIIETNNSSVR